MSPVITFCFRFLLLCLSGHNSPCYAHLMIFELSGTKIQIFQNEEEHLFHNRVVRFGIGNAEKFFEESFDNGVCTAGALVRILRKHNENEKKKEND